MLYRFTGSRCYRDRILQITEISVERTSVHHDYRLTSHVFIWSRDLHVLIWSHDLHVLIWSRDLHVLSDHVICTCWSDHVICTWHEEVGCDWMTLVSVYCCVVTLAVSYRGGFQTGTLITKRSWKYHKPLECQVFQFTSSLNSKQQNTLTILQI